MSRLVLSGGGGKRSQKPSVSLILNCESAVIDSTAKAASVPFSQWQHRSQTSIRTSVLIDTDIDHSLVLIDTDIDHRHHHGPRQQYRLGQHDLGQHRPWFSFLYCDGELNIGPCTYEASTLSLSYIFTLNAGGLYPLKVLQNKN